MSAPVAEFVSLEKLRATETAWRELCARSAEANPFAEPAFLLPLLAYEPPLGLALTLVWKDGRLIGLAAIRLPPLGVGLARIWQSAYAALPACVFDPDTIPAAMGALIAHLGDRTRLVGVLWPSIESGGAFAVALREVATGQSSPFAVAATTRRVALRVAGAAAFEASLNARRRKRWERQARRLAQLGKVETVSGAEAVEAFLAVEPRGWKGERGTAMADDPARLAFARTMLGAFLDAGRLDALALLLDGAPIAAGLMLIAGTRGYYWKSGYDEAFAEASPGLQLALAQTRVVTKRPGLEWLDSCAGEDHPMIGRLWSDRLVFEEVALGLRPGLDRPLRVWLAFGRARRLAREGLKRLLKRG